jgi:2-polyprenyl-3-methyl-5-hydroxy-6-metoxy-1,4-benzoquinol methylase
VRYNNSAYNAICPVCTHSENTLLYKVSSKEAANHFVVTQSLESTKLADIDHKIAELWNQKTAAVVACKNCGFAFADPFIAGDHEFYNLLSHASGEGAEYWKWEFEKTFKKIADIASGNSSLHLLEIGASTGDFIKRIARIIPAKNILCLEHSEAGVNIIRKAGIEAHSWNFHELGQKEGFLKKFDIVCLFQVLEHLDKLEDAFNTFNYVTKPNGHLFIGVPNGTKIKFNELNDALLDMPPNHIGRYSQKNLEFLGNKYGWTIEEIAIEPYTPLDVMKTVMYYQSLKRAQFPPAEQTTWYLIKQYIEIKYIRLQAIFMHKKLGETLWVHFRKLQ